MQGSPTPTAQAQAKVKEFLALPPPKKMATVRELVILYWAVFARVLVSMHFLNHHITELQLWGMGRPDFPWLSAPAVVSAVLVMINFKVHVFAWVLALCSAKESLVIFGTQLADWWTAGHALYINELMVKKLSTLGCVALVLAHDKFIQQAPVTAAFAGLLLSQPDPDKNNKRAVVLLTARLLLSTLFLFVGYGEIKRQLFESTFVHDGHVHRKRSEGDGHDQVVFKLIECFLALPFVVGFKTEWVARFLAASCVLEAVIYWRWWSSPLTYWYQLHAREHFHVNMAVAGGLLLLQSFGAGKYSVDQLLKKND